MRKIIHQFIVWYLKRCGNAFHNGPYDTPRGRYVVSMSEHDFNKFERTRL